MIQNDNAFNAPAESQATKPMENLTCLTIRTGNKDCIARFYPALFQLTLIKNGVEEKVELGFSGSRLLERLVRNPGDVIDRDELMSHAWSGRVVGQGSLNQQIYTLRQILADENDREIIQTLPRRGYLINPNYVDISLEAKPIAESLVSESLASPVTTPATPTLAVANASAKQWRIPVLAGVSTLLVIILAYHQSVKKNPTPINGKLLNITYAPQAPEELMHLIPYGEIIEQRLATKIKTPLHVVVGLHDNQLDVVCLRDDGSARTLHITESHFAQLSDSDLAPCLP